MRPGQNKRMRGRPTNNRRGPNPLTRSYESNGPDVKIRGNAHHVAEKYLQLARDAHTSGDPVAAENYLQHAEHYFRLIAAAQAAQLLAQSGRPPSEDDEDDDDDGGVLDRFASPAERIPAPVPVAPQPYSQPQPNLGAPNNQFGYNEGQPRFDGDRQPQQQDRNGFQQRQDRQQNRHQDRGPRQDRPYHERQGQEGQRDNRGQNDGRPREFRPYRDPNAPRDPQPVIEAQPTPTALPAFITAAPPRLVPASENVETPQPVIAEQPMAAAESTPSAEPAMSEPGDAGAEGRFPPRGRRRRLRSPYGFHAGPNGEDAAPPPAPEDAPISE
jgi:hypothetical protein